MYSAPSAHPPVLFTSAFFPSVYYSNLLLSPSSTFEVARPARSPAFSGPQLAVPCADEAVRLHSGGRAVAGVRRDPDAMFEF